jgi:hypothetical protein
MTERSHSWLRRFMRDSSPEQVFVRAHESCGPLHRGSHRQQGGHQLDAVSQVLDSEVLVKAVLIVVVVADRNDDGPRSERPRHADKGIAGTHGRDLRRRPAGALHGARGIYRWALKADLAMANSGCVTVLLAELPPRSGISSP